jgi:hypothetical protein
MVAGVQLDVSEDWGLCYEQIFLVEVVRGLE